MINPISLIKSKFITFLSVIFSFFTPVLPLIIAVQFFIVLDTIMGLAKANLTNKKNSNNFKKGFIPKVIIYTLIILIVFLADKTITNEFIKYYTSFDFVITRIIALILIFIEIWSIDENFKAIYGVSLIDKFNKFLAYLKSLFRNFLDNQRN